RAGRAMRTKSTKRFLDGPSSARLRKQSPSSRKPTFRLGRFTLLPRCCAMSTILSARSTRKCGFPWAGSSKYPRWRRGLALRRVKRAGLDRNWGRIIARFTVIGSDSPHPSWNGWRVPASSEPQPESFRAAIEASSMILVEERTALGESLLVIRQTDHAFLAAFFAREWGNERFSKPQPSVWSNCA